MATSSIFHNIRIKDPKQAEAFVAALEASEKDPWIRPEGPVMTVTSDPEVIRRIHELSKSAREKNKK